MIATNQWIAPYNMWLLSKYNCATYMCFDIYHLYRCGHKLVKYTYKYIIINKGGDFLQAKILDM